MGAERAGGRALLVLTGGDERGGSASGPSVPFEPSVSTSELDVRARATTWPASRRTRTRCRRGGRRWRGPRAGSPASVRVGDEKKIKKRIDEYQTRFANPFVAAERGYIDEVIMPHGTRKRVARALQMLRNKRLENPWKKHDNIPL